MAHLEPAAKDSDPYHREPTKPGPVYVEGDTEDSQSFEIERILDRRVKQLKKGTKVEYLVRWKGYGQEYDRWYPEAELQNARDLLRDYHHQTEQRDLPVTLPSPTLPNPAATTPKPSRPRGRPRKH